MINRKQLNLTNTKFCFRESIGSIKISRDAIIAIEINCGYDDISVKITRYLIRLIVFNYHLLPTVTKH